MKQIKANLKVIKYFKLLENLKFKSTTRVQQRRIFVGTH